MTINTALAVGALLVMTACTDDAGSEEAAPQFTDGCADATGIVLTNGQIHTMDADMSVVSTVRIEGDTIVVVNNDDSDTVAVDGDCVIDLDGSTVVPGLFENHSHILGRGTKPGHLAFDMDSARSWDDAVAVIERTIEENDIPLPEAGTVGTQNNFVTVIGAITPGQFAEGALPSTEVLNQFEHPVYIEAALGGGSRTNDAARAYFEANGLEVAEDGSVANTTGNFFVSSATQVLNAEQTDEDRVRGTLEVQAWAASVGITTGMTFDNSTAAQALFESGNAIMRVRSQVLGQIPPSNDDFETATAAALSEATDPMFTKYALGEFIDPPVNFFPTTAEDVFNDQTFLPRIDIAANLGATVHQHTLSELETTTYLDAFEGAAADISQLRWQLAHVPTMSVESMDRLNALGGGAVAANISYGSGRGFLTPSPPYKTLYDHDLPLGIGSDGGNVTVINPWLTVYHMTTGLNDAGAQVVEDSELLTVEESIRTFTIGNAWFSFDEGQLGSIEMGKLADLVVLSTDIFEMDEASDIRNTTSSLTIVNGKIVYSNSSVVACEGANSFGEWFPQTAAESC